MSYSSDEGISMTKDLENEYRRLNEEYDIVNKMEEDIFDKHRNHLKSKEDHSSCHECSPDVIKKNTRWVRTKMSEIISRLETVKILLEEFRNISKKTDEECYKIMESCSQYFYKYNSDKEEKPELITHDSHIEKIRKNFKKGCMNETEKEIVCRLLSSHDRLIHLSYDKIESRFERENFIKIWKEYLDFMRKMNGNDFALSMVKGREL